MGEITLEKKKQIENYIVASYFDRCKNVEAYCKGGDILKGSDEYDIPDLVVLIDVFGMSGVYIIHWNFLSDFGSELKNEFMIRIATERSITRNRCDSVDALNYSWISWKKQLEEKAIFLNDKRKEDLEKEIKELESQIEEWKTATKCSTPSQAKVVISTLTKAVVFDGMKKDCPLDFEIKFVRGDEK